MKHLDLISFRYPKTVSGKVEWNQYTVIILNPQYAGLTHAIKLNGLGGAEVKKLIAFFWPDEHPVTVRRNPQLLHILRSYRRSQVKSPLQFYRMYVRPMLRGFPDIYRKFNRRLMKGINYHDRGKLFHGPRGKWGEKMLG